MRHTLIKDSFSRFTQKIRTSPWAASLPYLHLILLSGGVRLYHLGFKSLWFDEAVLYWVSQGSPGGVIRLNADLNSTPPLYPLLVNLLSYLGSSEAILRSISYLAGVLGILAFFNLAKQYTSEKAALFSSILLSVALFHVEYSQELREYSMGFLFSVLLIYSYSRFIEKPDWNRSLLLLAISCVSIFTQYGLAIVLVALNLHFVIELNRSQNRKMLLLRWSFIQAISLIAVVIVYVVALRFQFTNSGFLHVEQGYWRGGLSGIPSFLYRQTYDLLLYFFPDPPVFLLGVLIGFLYLLMDRSLWSNLVKLILPILVAMVFAVLEFYPYVGARQTIYLAPFLFLFLAYGIDYILKVDVKGIIAISFMVLTLRSYVFQTYRYLQHPGTQNVRSLVEIIEEGLASGDSVYVCPEGIPAFRYYYKSSNEYLVGPVGGDRWKADLGGAIREDWQTSLAQAIEGDSRVWVVWVGQCGEKQMYKEFIAAKSEFDEIGTTDQAALFVVP